MDILIEWEIPLTRKDASPAFKPPFTGRRPRGWLVLALLAVPIVIYTSAARLASEEEFGYALADFCAFSYCVAVLYWVLYRWHESSRFAQRIYQGLSSATAFMHFTDSHVYYGTRGRVDIALSWDLLVEGGFRKSGLRLEVADVHLFVKASAFSEEQVGELADFLQQKKAGKQTE